ncbi:hypothetical protein [Chitinophaga sp. Cy-1792]|uniref:hypothetical protein n=1 Tax=Chitinophaga sp. Cy-1792 TaxID=2608339 RepID=UPI0014201D01|nr:hypothetical protein [Chitinophaga sp. Cy-1792]NIG55058.1 hypothetical protein [Chitinophaga sp. Cy-1792]
MESIISTGFGGKFQYISHADFKAVIAEFSWPAAYTICDIVSFSLDFEKCSVWFHEQHFNAHRVIVSFSSVDTDTGCAIALLDALNDLLLPEARLNPEFKEPEIITAANNTSKEMVLDDLRNNCRLLLKYFTPHINGDFSWVERFREVMKARGDYRYLKSNDESVFNQHGFNFKRISIRARLAYGALCLENAIKFYQQEHLNWTYLFDLIWSTTTTFMYSWADHMGEANPLVVMHEPFGSIEADYILEAEFNQLKEVYDQANPVLFKIIDRIHYAGSSNVDHGLTRYTILPMQQLADLMDEHAIPLPDITPFFKFGVEEDGGWGRAFSREEIYE